MLIVGFRADYLRWVGRFFMLLPLHQKRGGKCHKQTGTR
jgi:hypothetical protein